MSKRHPDFTLYRAALAADEAFHAELVRVYGASNAGDARYRCQHDDQRVSEAGRAKVKADERWLAEMREPSLDAQETETMTSVIRSVVTVRDIDAPTERMIATGELPGPYPSEAAAVEVLEEGQEYRIVGGVLYAQDLDCERKGE
jgi:hypothetical protein